MTIQTAAQLQYNRHTFYTVFLVSPTGEKTRLGSTQGKSGTGLIRMLRLPAVLDTLREKLGDLESLTFKKSATALTLSNGYKIEFGGTIRQESN